MIWNRTIRFSDVLSRYPETMARGRMPVPFSVRHAFQVCGCTGVVLGVVLGTTLIVHARVSLWVLAEIVLSAVVTFFALVMGTKIITGQERIIYYHHEIGVMAVTALLLWLTRRPLLFYLDVTILGVGLFLVCGRIGCLMAGCCHGRPYSWGVRYCREHAAAGFPSYLVGIRLFPIQAVESLWVSWVVVVGVAFVWIGRPPGTALAWYTVSYGVGRFFFEFARGDANRPYTYGYSQAQWLSLILTSTLLLAEFTHRIPFEAWHVLVPIGLGMTTLGVAVRRRLDRSRKFQILHPRHVSEVAEVMELAARPERQSEVLAPQARDDPAVHIHRTSLGIQISGSRIEQADGVIDHYALSMRGGKMNKESAAALASLLLTLRRGSGPEELLGGQRGVFHLLIFEAMETGL